MAASASGRARLFAVLGIVVVPLLFHFFIVETSGAPSLDKLSILSLFRASFVTVAAVTHWIIYGGLFLTFAVTLRPGREALLTFMARKLHGTISEEVRIYTRQVTYAWCAFFATQLLTSIALFVFAPLVVWSFFVNILDIPLVATMFVAEYLFRLHWLRNPPRHSLSAILSMIADVRKAREEWAGSP
ncbi:MAG TPA: hypothetical protein VGF92_03125 [Stellaceae bacterium]|jgi:hypothetical protein